MNTENIIINCLGASNTQILIDNEGIKTKEINYPVLLGLRLRCTTRNYGKSGTNIAKQEGREDSYIERAPRMEHGADVIIVQGGGNDCNHCIPLGELDSTDPSTYCGALRSVIRLIKSDFPESKLIISSSMRKRKEPQLREDDLKHIDFHNAFMAVSRSEGIEPINFYDDPELDPFNPESMPDGTHMSEKACKHMADIFADYIRNL